MSVQITKRKISRKRRELKEEVENILKTLEMNSQNQLNDKGLSHSSPYQKEAISTALKTIISKKPICYQKRITQELLGYGPLETLLTKDSVTEILINSHNTIWYESHGCFSKWSDNFITERTYQSFVHRICQEAGEQIDWNTPHLDGQWKNFRLHIIGPPLSEHIRISLRKQPKNPWTLEKLEEEQWCSKKEKILLEKLIQGKKNLLIIGPTGTGKTSVLNALLQKTKNNERVIIVEDTSELCAPNDLSLKLLTRQDLNGKLKEYTLADLCKQSLRMRPERLIMGEVRGTEAKDLLLMLSTGHAGSMCSLHASHPKEALRRLEILVQMGAKEWDLQVIRQLIQFSFHYIICLKKEGIQRVLNSIHKVGSLEAQGILVETIYQKIPILNGQKEVLKITRQKDLVL